MHCDLFEGISKLAPSLLILIGWIVLYRIQVNQNRLKVLREDIDRASIALSDIQTDAIKYHTLGAIESNIHPSALIASIEALSRKIQHWPNIAAGNNRFFSPPADPNCLRIDTEYMKKLRQTITLNHFDLNESPLPPSAPQLQEIQNACNELSREISRALVFALD